MKKNLEKKLKKEEILKSFFPEYKKYQGVELSEKDFQRLIFFTTSNSSLRLTTTGFMILSSRHEFYHASVNRQRIIPAKFWIALNHATDNPWYISDDKSQISFYDPEPAAIMNLAQGKPSIFIDSYTKAKK